MMLGQTEVSFVADTEVRGRVDEFFPGATSDDANHWYEVALSADGNTALIGGDGESESFSDVGGAWVFVR